MTGNEETISYKLIGIVTTKRKLHSSYAEGKKIRETDCSWGQGINWKVKQFNEDWDEVKIFTELYLYRKKDHFEIASLFVTTTYHVNRGLGFDTKYKLLVLLCNNASGHIQGAWRMKIKNDCINRYVPQSYNKILEMETDLKRMIYEDWED